MMPIKSPRIGIQEHREKSPGPLFPAMVHRLLTPSEVKASAGAQAALKQEADKLIRLKTWDYSSVRECADVMSEARRVGKTAHVGHVFSISSIKNDELPEGDPLRKHKARIVFGGNRIRNEFGAHVQFSEAGAAPATSESCRLVGAYGVQLGHTCESSGAESAYTLALLGGDTTWVRLPRWLWLPSWDGMKDPVVILRLSLYGHP